jgi:hypothetical protein
MKYKSHRRYREPVITEAPPKIKIVLKAAPKVRDVMKAKEAITRLVRKFGTRRYRRHRDKADRIVHKALKKYHIRHTSTEEYWRLAFICILIGQ